MKLGFSQQFFQKQKTQISNFMKIRAVWAEMLHADRRMDRHDEANSRFSQFFERIWKQASTTLRIHSR